MDSLGRIRPRPPPPVPPHRTEEEENEVGGGKIPFFFKLFYPRYCSPLSLGLENVFLSQNYNIFGLKIGLEVIRAPPFELSPRRGTSAPLGLKKVHFSKKPS